MVRLIRSEEDYAKALAEIDALVQLSPEPGSAEADRLELLSLVVERYESQVYAKRVPSPSDAIRFRMEQMGLEPRDLVPIVGSRGRVSEVLSGSRPLSLRMIRAINGALGIPIEALVGAEADESADDNWWNRFPVAELVSRGWIDCDRRSQGSIAAALEAFLGPLGGQGALALARRTRTVRASRDMSGYALTAWAARVVSKASPACRELPKPALSMGDLPELVRQSVHADGPVRAVRWLCVRGVPVVVERHLQGTWLDGAAISAPSGPVIGLTLRHDRVDNFWFTLLHELGHLLLHLGSDEAGEGRAFFDDLDSGAGNSQQEQEADEFASEALVPSDAWVNSAVRFTPSPESAQQLAGQLGIHVALVAGRVRHETKNFRLLSKHVGAGEVGILFGAPHGGDAHRK